MVVLSVQSPDFKYVFSVFAGSMYPSLNSGYEFSKAYAESTGSDYSL